MYRAVVERRSQIRQVLSLEPEASCEASGDHRRPHTSPP